MPRDSGTGVASPPSGTNIVAGTPITSAPVNTLFQDVYSIFNQSVPAGLLPPLSFLSLAGGTLTGPLTLSGNATANLHAVTLQQMTAALATKSDTSHTHTSSAITDFNTAADTRANARIAASSIDALADVAITSVAVGHTLRWNGTNFVNVPGASFTDYDKGALNQNTTYTQAHGLGALPSRVDFYLECTTAELGYTVGQRISFTHAANTLLGIQAIVDATNVELITRVTNTFQTLDKPSRSDAVLTNSRWKVIFRVFS